MFNWLRNIIQKWKMRKERKKRLEELRQRDPFIYK